MNHTFNPEVPLADIFLLSVPCLIVVLCCVELRASNGWSKRGQRIVVESNSSISESYSVTLVRVVA